MFLLENLSINILFQIKKTRHESVYKMDNSWRTVTDVYKRLERGGKRNKGTKKSCPNALFSLSVEVDHQRERITWRAIIGKKTTRNAQVGVPAEEAASIITCIHFFLIFVIMARKKGGYCFPDYVGNAYSIQTYLDRSAGYRRFLVEKHLALEDTAILDLSPLNLQYS